MRLLVVEDHDVFAKAIKRAFEQTGYVVDIVGDCGGADAALSTVSYDAMILDRGLPDGDGLTLLQDLRRNGSGLPVLLLTSRCEVDERIEGLDSGADDYVPKPVDMEELIARIRALLRRPAATIDLILRLGNVTFDTRSREVRVSDCIVDVSRRETDVLEHLLRRANRVVSKDVLEEKLYGFDEEVSSNSVEVHVSRLRKRLQDAGADVQIRTRRGMGYVLAEGETIVN